jgi:hypothetical protein
MTMGKTNRITRWIAVFAAVAIGVISLRAPSPAIGQAAGAAERKQGRGQAILDWNAHADTAIRTANQSPPRRSRAFAMVQLAVHDAVNGVVRRYERYASAATDPAASLDAAVAVAAHDVLVGLFPAQQGDLDTKLAVSLAGIDENQNHLQRGVTLGQAVAADMLVRRATDGAGGVGGYAQPAVPGIWRPTPPAFAPALEPNWPSVTPFGLASAAQFRADPPFALDTPEYAAELAEVRDIGSATSTTRTADETHYAHFWYEPSPDGWNRLARTALTARPQGAAQTARGLALLHMSIADAYIASFETKYYYNQWRPITAIREADTDGNAVTDPADPAWTPLRPIPPMPDHVSGHSAAGWSAYAPLVDLFGADGAGVPITMTTATAVPAGSTRTWTSFAQAADENDESRVKVGIHFRKSVTDGETMGLLIGQHNVANYLRSLD